VNNVRFWMWSIKVVMTTTTTTIIMIVSQHHYTLLIPCGVAGNRLELQLLSTDSWWLCSGINSRVAVKKILIVKYWTTWEQNLVPNNDCLIKSHSFQISSLSLSLFLSLIFWLVAFKIFIILQWKYIETFTKVHPSIILYPLSLHSWNWNSGF
jgi:hypothetical protein